jgi:hypothetical protein
MEDGSLPLQPQPMASFAILIDLIALIELLLVRSQGPWSFATVISLIDLIALIELLLERPRAGGPLLQ